MTSHFEQSEAKPSQWPPADRMQYETNPLLQNVFKLCWDEHECSHMSGMFVDTQIHLVERRSEIRVRVGESSDVEISLEKDGSVNCLASASRGQFH